MALLEAMSLGLPAVALDCPTGPGEVIEHRVNGMLVPPGDVSAFAAAAPRDRSRGVRRSGSSPH